MNSSNALRGPLGQRDISEGDYKTVLEVRENHSSGPYTSK